MVKVTIQACLDMKDLDFLSTFMEKHALNNHSEAIRMMITRYKGMEDWILARRKTESQINVIRESKQTD
jgi:hypothetical protein